MKFVLIKEGKTPPDARVALTPSQCRHLIDKYGIEIAIQPSPIRCIADADYIAEGIPLMDDVSAADVLIGIKEVPIKELIADKTYLFFSHTIKKQAHNRPLLQAILEKNIRLVDYEVLTDEKHERLIAFGKFAGIVGAHNGLMTWANRTGDFQLQQMHTYKTFAAAKAVYPTIKFPALRVVVTGTGRVAGGAVETLTAMGFKAVSPEAYLTERFDYPVFTQLGCEHYVKSKSGSTFQKEEFYADPSAFENAFTPYTSCTDIFMNCIFWDNRAPQFFTFDDMRQDSFSIKVIADITCDIAPVASVPSTLRESSIAEPVYGFYPATEQLGEPYKADSIDVMAIDNLPSELPLDASAFFGEQFSNHIVEELLSLQNTGVVKRAIIADKGELGPHFQYLADYVAGEVHA